jgi:membrane protein YdbS with pleckstrin-like domain
LTDLTSTTRGPELRLQDGEELVAAGRADRRWMLSGALASSLVMSAVALPLTALFNAKADSSDPLMIAACLLVVTVILGMNLGAMKMSWNWHRWWLSDRRLVVRHGIIGYQLQSVPLDRIVDVTLKSSWWDRIWGLQHIHVRDMTGEASGSVSRGLRLLAVDEAEDISEMILKRCPSVMSERSEMGEVVHLLRQLVQKTS